MISMTSYVMTSDGPVLASKLKKDMQAVFFMLDGNNRYIKLNNAISMVETKKDQPCCQVNDLVIGTDSLICIGEDTYVRPLDSINIFSINSLDDVIKSSAVYTKESLDKQNLMKITTDSGIFLIGPTEHGPFHMVLER